MRGPNKMPPGYRPNKKGLKQKYTKHISVDMSESDFEFVELLTSYLHISKAEAVRRCVEGAKLQLTLMSMPKREEK